MCIFDRVFAYAAMLVRVVGLRHLDLKTIYHCSFPSPLERAPFFFLLHMSVSTQPTERPVLRTEGHNAAIPLLHKFRTRFPR